MEYSKPIDPKVNETTGRFSCMYHDAIGIDVHAEVLVCCYQHNDTAGEVVTEEFKQFGTSISQLEAFAQWCWQRQPQIILMESTGVLWQSPYESLEAVGFGNERLALVNARDVKARKGHKTDKNDAQHLAELARLGAFKKSFVPSPLIRRTRLFARTYIKTREDLSREKNRYQKALTILGSRARTVFSDVNGITAKIILTAFLNEPAEKFERIVHTKSARLKATPRQILDALRPIEHAEEIKLLRTKQAHIKMLESMCNDQLNALRSLLSEHAGLLRRLQQIPGIKETTALLILAEIGPDLRSFPSNEKFCGWLGICPGNNESAGKRYSGRPAKGNRYLRSTLVEAANGIALSRKGYLWQRLQAFKERRGRNRAIGAVAHLLARIVYVLIKTGCEYVENLTAVLKQHRLRKLLKDMRAAKQVGLVATRDGVADIDTGEMTRFADRR